MLSVRLCLAAITAMAGCGYTSTTYTRTIHQTAMVPAPGGPHAMGPLQPRQLFGVEGGFSAAMVRGSNRSRDDGRPGQAALNKGLRGRFSFGAADWLELGADLEYRSVYWGTGIARDVDAGDVHSAGVFMGGPQVRVSTTTGPVRLGAGVELSFAALPYRWEVDETKQWVHVPGDGPTAQGRQESHFSREGISCVIEHADLDRFGTKGVSWR